MTSVTSGTHRPEGFLETLRVLSSLQFANLAEQQPAQSHNRRHDSAHENARGDFSPVRPCTPALLLFVRHQRLDNCHIHDRHPDVEVKPRVLFEAIALDHAPRHRLGVNRRDVIAAVVRVLQSPP